jgi:oxygen-independent coproporphyrinogen-3 oxidase
MEGLGIYVQTPFCASKCTFCNFSSRVAPHSVFDGYTAALEREAGRLPELLRHVGARQDILALPVDTVYFGGGTPPILGMERLERISCALRRCFPSVEAREFTVEATPGSVGPH